MRALLSELLTGGIVQARVVFALALRETRTRFGAHQLGYLWALLEPVFWIGTFAAMFYLVERAMPDGMEVVPFLATGVVTYQIAVTTADKVSVAIDGNKTLLFYPHVQPLDLVFARSGLEFATQTTVFVVLMGGHAMWTQHLEVDDILMVLVGLGLAGLFGMALGTVLCALTVYSNSVQRIKTPVMRPLFWISGLFFTANAVPSNFREYLLWNPIMHCVELVRDGWFPSYTARYASASYVMIWIIVLAFVGLTLERRVRAKVQLT